MPPKLKRPCSPSIPPLGASGDAATATTATATDLSSTHRAKKLKLLASHSVTSPFPAFAHPTPTEAAQVHALLSATHPDLASRPRPASEANNSAGTCGSVPNVLESLIGTILSQNTSSRNSTAAKRGLDAAFGRNNFAAIALAKRQDVVEAIKTGGLANKKAGVIQNVLREVRERHGGYSLQHLAGVPVAGVNVKAEEKGKARAAPTTATDEEAMAELVSYDGVGPKTASCVLLFCLGRSSFPVDTHVFRLSRLLGWVPPKADRVTAQAHLDLMIPNDLKFGLHVLMVGHGRRCKGCKGNSGGKGECVLKRWLKEKKGAKEEELGAVVAEAEEQAADAGDAGGTFLAPLKLKSEDT
ncbi:DNA glycosylase [Lentinus tigrinus ALCF2SS1-7]|uniref:DNA glycosylase n=1 Tax=Lentinus tigrinus ALCF2SS1-6 TaxID=1328759 RepID=A0A5C2S931_9APHY|nr:DNA glycosylase [Lentinus tigrinus ALCF2SS1-6]RPD70897.1 DNA glycosylase [Lentinus tigrinus ALCF2SS1-7]